jgi:hypothetical protein
MPPKTVCPISRKDFDSHAKDLDIVINGESMKVPVKKFSTGSLGWYLNKKMDVKINGVAVTVQIGLNMTIVGSKDLAPDAPKPGEAAHAPHASLTQHDPNSTLPPD